MSKWLTKFLPDKNGTDKPDRFSLETNMSVLSVPSEGLLDQNLGNMPEVRPDKPDRFNLETNMSVLSVPSWGLLAGKKPYLFDGDFVLQNFEERIAIAQYDGGQASLQAQRIAYLDAFVDVLVTLLHKNSQANQRENWLDQRVKDAKDWLITQGLEQPE